MTCARLCCYSRWSQSCEMKKIKAVSHQDTVLLDIVENYPYSATRAINSIRIRDVICELETLECTAWRVCDPACRSDVLRTKGTVVIAFGDQASLRFVPEGIASHLEYASG